MPRSGRKIAYAFLFLFFASASFDSKAAPAGEGYESVLGPTPITHTTKGQLTGDGAVAAVLIANNLKVTGTFQGMLAPATDAHVMLGDGIGIPGSPILDLTVTPADHGDFSGSFKLTRAQITALHKGLLYIQINSQKGPAPGGNLWGWLLPEHVKAGQDEPILGDWYLPQGKGLKALQSGRQS